jgi:methionyl-tRNA formyltransferase
VKIVFAGTPETAVPTLSALISAGHHVVAVLTRPDAPIGRKAVMTPSAVAQAAVVHGLHVIKAARIDADVITELQSLNAELGVVVAFGAMFPPAALDVPHHGWINLHFSALPTWRGAAPVQWTLISGSGEAATTVFRLVREMDAGDVASVESHPLRGDETSAELLERLAQTGAQQVRQVVSDISRGAASFTPQEGEPTFAGKLSVADGELQADDSGIENYNRFRGVTHEPGAWLNDGEIRLKVHQASLSAQKIDAGVIAAVDGKVFWGTQTEALELIEVQPAGKQRMSARDWARGRR